MDRPATEDADKMRSIKTPRRAHEIEPVRIYFEYEDGLTRQSFKDECDINRIVEQYARTGIIPVTPRGQPQYGDNPEQTLFEAALVQAEIRSQEEDEYLNPPPEPLTGSESDDQEPTGEVSPEIGSEADTAPQGATVDE